MANLPDLVPWISQENCFVYDWTVQGDTLRLTTSVANIGSGPLELRGGSTTASTQEVYQRIYNEDGSHQDRLAGEFIYHPSHGHLHFEDFAEYRLREVTADGGVGDVVATGSKVSFCLIDVERYSGDAGGRTFNSCGQVQGISVGWADVYDKGLPGQDIDITGVTNGQYWLEVVSDPLNQIREENETNNVARILINLDRPGGEPAISPDAYEDNDTMATANLLAPPEDYSYSGLNIDRANDADWYRITASDTGTIGFDLDFVHAQGDIDMRVYNEAGNRIGISQSVGDGESLSFAATTGDQFYVEVYGYNGATNPGYTLNVDQPGEFVHPPDPEPDEFETNDSFASATALSPVEIQAYDGLSIHTPGDADYFRVVAANTGTMKIHLDFNDSVGDLIMHAYDMDQNLLMTSMSRTDHEHIDLTVEAGTEYYVVVEGEHGDINPEYTLTFEQPGFSVPSTENRVNDIAGTTQYLDGIGDEDVFVIDGLAAEYGWDATEDGQGVVVWGDTGHDLLYGFETIRFTDMDVPLSQSGNEVADLYGITQYLTGTSDNDVFVIDGTSSEYNHAPTEDGQGIVIWDVYGNHDLLYGFEAVRFNDTTLDLTAPPQTGGQTVADDPATTQYLIGSTAETDTFVVAAASTGYGWEATDDGGYVVWDNAAGSHDILYDFDRIEFTDTVVELA